MYSKNMLEPVDNSEVVNVKVPKRVLHFSDGTLEEYSDDESDTKSVAEVQVDPTTLTWIPWFGHYAWATGTKMLGYCDYVGEGIADFLGITTPKYQLELSEHERIQAEKRNMEEESRGWVDSPGNIPLVTNPPSQRNPEPAIV